MDTIEIYEKIFNLLNNKNANTYHKRDSLYAID